MARLLDSQPSRCHNRYKTSVNVRNLTRKSIGRFVEGDIHSSNGLISQLKPWLKYYLVGQLYSDDTHLGLQLLCEYSKLYDSSYLTSGVSFQLELLDHCFVIAELLRVLNRNDEYQVWVKETIPLVYKPFIKYRGTEYFLRLLDNSNSVISPSVLVEGANLSDLSTKHSKSIVIDKTRSCSKYADSCPPPLLIDRKAREECIKEVQRLKHIVTSGDTSSTLIDEINSINRYLAAPEFASLYKLDNAPQARYKMAIKRLFERQTPHLPYARVIYERHHIYSIKRGGASLNLRQAKNLKLHHDVPEVWVAKNSFISSRRETIDILEDTLGYSITFLFAPVSPNFLTYAELEEALLAIKTFMAELWSKGIWENGLNRALSAPSLPSIVDILNCGISYYRNFNDRSLRSESINKLCDFGAEIKIAEWYVKGWEDMVNGYLDKLSK